MARQLARQPPTEPHQGELSTDCSPTDDRSCNQEGGPIPEPARKCPGLLVFCATRLSRRCFGRQMRLSQKAREKRPGANDENNARSFED